MSIEEILPYFSGKGKILLLIFFCIPFSQILGLAISLPIPFSSYIASAAIVFIGIGILNDDGIWIGVGYALAIFYITFVAITINSISVIDIIYKLIYG